MAVDWPYLALHDADGNQLLPLTDDPDTDPFLVAAVDAGAKDIREDVEDDPDDDGTRDYTRFSGGSGVTVELTALGNDEKPAGLWLDDLLALCQADTRTYLHARRVDWPARRRILVRGASGPRDLSDLQPDVQMQWKAPLGYFEDVDWSTARLGPAGATTSGLSAPVSAPVFTPPADSSAEGVVLVGGPSMATRTRIDAFRPWWELDIYGPCVAPVLTSGAGWQVAGKPTLVIADGHFVRVTPKTVSGPSVLGDGDPGQDLYGRIDFSRTTWERLLVGRNVLALTATSAGSGFHGQLRWRARQP